MVLRVNKLGPAPMRVGAVSGCVEAGGHWCFAAGCFFQGAGGGGVSTQGEGMSGLGAREAGQAWYWDSNGYLFDGGRLSPLPSSPHPLPASLLVSLLTPSLLASRARARPTPRIGQCLTV